MAAGGSENEGGKYSQKISIPGSIVVLSFLFVIAIISFFENRKVRTIFFCVKTKSDKGAIPFQMRIVIYMVMMLSTAKEKS